MISDDQLSSRAKGYLIGSIIMMALSFVMVTARISCRIWLSKKKLWWDDFFIVLSFLFALAFGTCVNIAMENFGWDRHIWDIPVDKLAQSVKFYILAKLLFFAASTCVRMGLLFSYLWIVRGYAGASLKRILYGCLIANGVFCLVAILLSVFECSPVSAAWTFPKPANAKCMNEGVLTTVIGGFLTLSDLIVSILPIPIVAKLNMPFRERVQVCVLLSLGVIATIAGVCREVWIYKAFLGTNDQTWESLPLWACAEVEIYVGLFCACLPSIKPLGTKIFGDSTAKSNHFEHLPDRSVHSPVNLLRTEQTQLSEGRTSYQSTSDSWEKSGAELQNASLPSPTFSLFPRCVQTTERDIV